jgi:hypothetical protein
MKKFIIFAPDYIDVNGGTIALHKLCDMLNRAGHEAFIYPDYESYELHAYNLDEVEVMKNKINKVFGLTEVAPIGVPISIEKAKAVFWVNESFLTPVYIPDRQASFDEEWVVIYPEITFGNPLRAKNVVRWLLHNPGFWTGKIYYGKNELYFRYSDIFDPFQFPGSKTSDLILYVLDLPLDLFYEPPQSSARTGTAYCLRKGQGRKIEHNLENSILIDGKSNKEIADIFRSIETFISYDTNTFYSSLAVLCGCNSVVVPLDGVSEISWRPDEKTRYGVAYGIENLEKAKSTAGMARATLLDAERNSQRCVLEFIAEVNRYFL